MLDIVIYTKQNTTCVNSLAKLSTNTFTVEVFGKKDTKKI